MARINLLPWREERRQALKRQFLVILVGSALLGVLVVLLGVRIIDAMQETQQARNNYLQAEINVLNKQVAEIRELERQKRALLDRMRVIQDLQGTRPLIVRIFDEIVRTLPDGLFFQSLARQGSKIDVTGIAESNNRVSSLMRKLDSSEWFADPNLSAVSAAPAFGEQASSFKLSYSISAPAQDGDAVEVSQPKPSRPAKK